MELLKRAYYGIILAQTQGPSSQRRTAISRGTQMVASARSVQESEKPKRNLVAKTDFHVIVHDIAVGKVRNLLEGLALSADLEKPLAVNLEITLRRIDDLMTGSLELIQEKRLADGADIDHRRQGAHEIRIVAVDLVRP